MAQEGHRNRVTQSAVIGSASGWGAQLRSTEKGPEFLQAFSLLEKLAPHRISAFWSAMLLPDARAADLSLPNGEETLPYLIPHLERLGQSVAHALDQGNFPLALGGDHVMAVGTFSGAIRALDAQQNFGLIWMDAHMDAHTPQTSPSMAYHGMPVATLLGYGDQSLTNIGGPNAKINPRDLVIIGVRSFESGEAALLRELGVKIVYCPEVLDRGFEVVLKEAIHYVSRHTKAFGVSLDLDVFDPNLVPGVGSPVSHGLIPDQVIPHLDLLRRHPQFRVAEITEFNPDQDRDQLTAQTVMEIMRYMLPQQHD
jgi:arginase